MSKETFDLIYSIGEDCSCAMYLDKANLRTASGPFDWLTKASFETRIKLILTDFSSFLDEENMAFLKKENDIQNDEKYDYFENKLTGFHFYHDFPSNIPIKDSLPSVKAKYQKRIKLFYEKIKKKNKVLFVWFSHDKILSDETLKKASVDLEAKFNKPIHLLVIEHNYEIKIGESQFSQPNKNISKYSLYTQSKDQKGNLTTLGNVENCLPIFKKFSYYRPIHLIILNFFLPIIKYPLAFFIRSKEKRRRVRKFQFN